MILREGLDGLRALTPGSVVSIGNFDGVHLGHRQIVRTCDSLRTGSPSRRVAIVTFEPHPLTVLKPELAPPRLTSPATKRDLLALLGVDEYVVLPPTPDVLGCSAESFWQLLKDEARVAHLVEGETFTFGKGRGGNIQRLRDWSKGTSVGIHVVAPVVRPLLDLQIVPVSSSLVRFLIDGGRARDAAILLGRPYLLEGTVVPGHQRGRGLGAPTANLNCGEQLVPADGVYAARCEIDGTSYPVALSIGTMPTFGENERQIEVFVLGFSGNLYGKVLRVEVLDWVREQWKLSNADALRVQIEKDVHVIRRVVERLDPGRPIAIGA